MKVIVSTLLLTVVAFGQNGGGLPDGKALFDQNCALCHATDTADRRIGPSLKGIKDGKLPDAIGKLATHDSVLKQINDGGGGMPVFRDLLTKEQKEAIVSYVLKL